MAKINDLTLLSDIFPTGYHGAVHRRGGPGLDRVRGRRRTRGSGLRRACQLLGAAVVIVGDMIPERLAQARSFGCETVDLQQGRLAGGADRRRSSACRRWTAAVDCVGFEARGHGADAAVEAPATVLNSLMTVTRAGGALGIPGLYVTDDPGGVDENAKIGNLSIRIGLGWAKSHSFTHRPVPGDELQPRS